jgi:DNA-binding NarL/FixJ family response regulator
MVSLDGRSDSRREVVVNLDEYESLVLRHTCTGASNAAIGQQLHISESYVSQIMTRLYQKHGLQYNKDINQRVCLVLAALHQSS